MKILASMLIAGIAAFFLLASTPLPDSPNLSPEPQRPPRPVYRFIEEAPRQGEPDHNHAAGISAPFGGYERWSKLSYESVRDGNWEIYGSMGDGSHQERLTVNPANDIQPRLNRGGTRLVFASDRDGDFEIYTANPDGSNLFQLTHNEVDDYSPDWSPDGSMLVFVSESTDNDGDIFTMNADGSHQTRLTTNTSFDGDPDWSPDGINIAFSSYRDGGYRIWIMNKSGTGQTRLSELPYSSNPVWSPDTFHIAFSADPDRDGWFELCTMNSDGSHWTELYDENVEGMDVLAHSWSTDKSFIAYSRVSWVLVDNNWYWTEAYLYAIGTNYYPTFLQLSDSGMDLNPDWQTIDVNPPNSMFQAVPEYTPSTGGTVHWGGYDVGPAGIDAYFLQKRLSTDPTWSNWFWDTPLTSGEISGYPGQTLYLRSIARDAAWNFEAWSPDPGDAWTKFYSTLLAGSIHDVRGHPVVNPQVSIDPQPWETIEPRLDGSFIAHLKSSETHIFSSGKANYASLPLVIVPGTDITNYEMRLPAVDNRITDGNFDESVFGGWVTGGDMQVNLNYDPVHTGRFSAGMGAPIPLDSPTTITNCSGLSVNPKLVIDSADTLHAVWEDSCYSGLVYAFHPAHGTWSNPIKIADGGRFDLAIGANDTLHLVQFGGYGVATEIRYAYKSAGNAWSQPQAITDSYDTTNAPVITIDYSGNLYCAWGTYSGYSDDGGIWVTTKPAGGSWTSPVEVSTLGGAPSLTATPDGFVHLVWIDFSVYRYQYQNRSPAGVWSAPQEIAADPNIAPGGDLAAGADGIVHFVYGSEAGLIYRARNQAGVWQSPELVIGGTAGDWANYRKVTAGSDGTTYIAWVTNAGSIGIRQRSTQGIWSSKRTIGNGNAFTIDLTEKNNLIYTIWEVQYPYVYEQEILYSSFPAAGPQIATLSQVVDLPPSLHAPTLSFVYQLLPDDSLQSVFRVQINQTEVYSDSTPVLDWKYVWLDMQPWAGKPITLTFSTENRGAVNPLKVYLDEVSLGSWLTPVINASEPALVEDWEHAAITVTGSNLITPTVRLGNLVIAGVTRVDDQTLRVPLSSLVYPGTYDLWVINQGGQEAVLPGAITVGRRIFLPLLVK